MLNCGLDTSVMLDCASVMLNCGLDVWGRESGVVI